MVEGINVREISVTIVHPSSLGQIRCLLIIQLPPPHLSAYKFLHRVVSIYRKPKSRKGERSPPFM
jgi:hypothetical protein